MAETVPTSCPGTVSSHDKITALISSLDRQDDASYTSIHPAGALCQGRQLAGLAVEPARTVVVSEEAAFDWDARCRRLGIAKMSSFFIAPSWVPVRVQQIADGGLTFSSATRA